MALGQLILFDTQVKPLEQSRPSCEYNDVKGSWGHIEILCFKSYGRILDCVDCGTGKPNKCCVFFLVYSSNKNRSDPKHLLPSLPRLGPSLVFHHSLRPWLPSKETLEMDIAVSKIKTNHWNHECSLNTTSSGKYKVNLSLTSALWFHAFSTLWFSRICCLFAFN